ncbi:GDP-mannose-dependent alpha-(1-6)-phosphatidylinositol monomannoside mannosyltransferase [termite gut metagenome]|uniref:GDP-mannose-dependent alpha-(1-6)-phosphatidylinositol monomannoside mannosyltransferase n=1 Tax=termite gut metagenome TaxID=433724 RepID=A0A5J4QUX3_9ZZZZ
MNKKKILFIIHLPPPIHGAAMMGKYIYESSLINENFDCYYINLSLAKKLQNIGKHNIKKLFTYIVLLKNIIKKIIKIKPTLCYVTPNARGKAFYKDFVVVMLLKVMQQQVIIHYHNKGVFINQNRIFENFLYKKFFKNLNVILLSEILYSDIQKYVKRKNIFICPNGIPEQRNNNFLKHRTTIFNILFLSNMMKEKGVWELLEACKRLKESGETFHCDFVGGWSDITKETFEIKLKEYKLDDCIVAHGSKYDKEKESFMIHADVFVFPTYYHNECFPLVLLEAMQYSIPCISTNEGAISEIIEHEKAGLIVEKKNSEMLFLAIKQFILNKELCIRMGEAGYIRFKANFTLDKFEKQMTKILQITISSFT